MIWPLTFILGAVAVVFSAVAILALLVIIGAARLAGFERGEKQ